MTKYDEKILIFQNNYSRLLGIFQNNSIDFVDEDDFYLNTKKKIIEQLRQYQYIDQNQEDDLLKSLL